MKTITLLRIAALLVFAFYSNPSFAVGGGTIMGQVTDPDTKEPVAFATLIFENQGTKKIITATELGFYDTGNLPAGVYTITTTFMSNKATMPGVTVKNDEQQELNLTITMSMKMGEVIVPIPVKPIDPYKIQEFALPRAEITKLPILKVIDMTAMLPGVVSQDGEIYVRGSRAGSLSYYIDGALVMGNPNIALCGLDSYRALTGFIPPKYGDTTGGVILMETRNYFAER